MEKKKLTWWKIIGILVLLPFVIMYFIFKYIYKFYKSEKFNKKQKILISAAVFVGICLLGVISSITRGPELESVSIDNIELYKGESKKIDFNITPDNANIDSYTFKDYDHEIISFEDNKLTALKSGTTEVVCELTDAHSNKIKSNTFKVTVNLTEEQIAEENAKAAEKAAKEAEEAAKKAAEEQKELEEKRNTISTSEATSIKQYCEDIINSILKAPSTAEYPGGWLDPLEGWNMAKNNNLVTVSSYVDAQNSFGAKIRSEFIIQIQMQDDGTGKATYVQFDGEVISGTYQ